MNAAAVFAETVVNYARTLQCTFVSEGEVNKQIPELQRAMSDNANDVQTNPMGIQAGRSLNMM